jgi:hypothetical protein
MTVELFFKMHTMAFAVFSFPCARVSNISMHSTVFLSIYPNSGKIAIRIFFIDVGSQLSLGL